MKNRKKEITLLVIAILVIVSMIAGATYAFFKAQTGPAANFDINATTSTTDNLTFSTEDEIVLNVTAENLKKSGSDLSDTAIARARLIANNSSNSATAYYNVYLLIEENEMEYSSYTKEGQPNLEFMNKEEKEKANLEGYIGVPELVLSVKKNDGEYKIIKRLTPTDGGYDITEADGLYAIGENEKITTTSDVTDTWEVKVTFKNLNYNQQLNTGRSLKGKIIITAEKLLYEINDAVGLRKLSEEVKNGDSREGIYIVLTDDIDLGTHENDVSNFTPIGTENNPFQGNFNGDNHTISNLYINNTTSNMAIGLFGVIQNSNINNLIIKGEIKSSTKAAIGSLVGNSHNTTFKNINNYVNIENNYNDWHSGGIVGAVLGETLLENCFNYGNISGGNQTGGLIGYVNPNVTLTINNSANKGSVSNNIGSVVGGLIGINYSTNFVRINNSHNEGTINSTSTQRSNIGGIIGQANGSIEINDSYNIGNVTANGESGAQLGGLIGYASKKVIINNSYNDNNTLKISPNGFDIFAVNGGLVGVISNQSEINIIKNSHNSGTIINGNRVGGIIGSIESGIVIDRCFNTGNIQDEGEIWTSQSQIGGLIGVANSWSFFHLKDIIINSYNLGNIIANNETTTHVSGILQNMHSNNLILLNSYNIGNLDLQSIGDVSGLVFSGNKGLQNQSTEKNTNILNNVYNLGITSSVNSNKYSLGYFELDMTTNDIKNTYYFSGENDLGSNIDGIGTSMPINQMKNQSFVDKLNQNIESINLEEIDPVLKDYKLVNWKLGNDGYPTLDF